MLVRVVKRVDVVVCPAARPGCEVFALHFGNDHIAELGTEAEAVDSVRERVRVLVLEVIFQVVHVQVAVGEGLSGGDVEVSNDLVDLDATLETASFLALCV